MSLGEEYSKALLILLWATARSSGHDGALPLRGRGERMRKGWEGEGRKGREILDR